MNRPLLRYGLLCLCLAMLGTPAGLAQPAPPVRAKIARPKVVFRAWLELRFDGQGAAQATLRMNFPPPNPELWQHALQSALRAPLERVREKRTPRGWELHAHADAVLRRSDGVVEGTLDLQLLLGLLRIFNVGELSLSLEHPSAGFSECSEGEPHRGLVTTHYSWEMPVASSPPQPVRLAFGYSPGQAWRLWLPIAFLLAAVGLGVGLSRGGARRTAIASRHGFIPGNTSAGCSSPCGFAGWCSCRRPGLCRWRASFCAEPCRAANTSAWPFAFCCRRRWRRRFARCCRPPRSPACRRWTGRATGCSSKRCGASSGPWPSASAWPTDSTTSRPTPRPTAGCSAPSGRSSCWPCAPAAASRHATAASTSSRPARCASVYSSWPSRCRCAYSKRICCRRPCGSCSTPSAPSANACMSPPRCCRT